MKFASAIISTIIASTANALVVRRGGADSSFFLEYVPDFQSSQPSVGRAMVDVWRRGGLVSPTAEHENASPFTLSPKGFLKYKQLADRSQSPVIYYATVGDFSEEQSVWPILFREPVKGRLSDVLTFAADQEDGLLTLNSERLEGFRFYNCKYGTTFILAVGHPNSRGRAGPGSPCQTTNLVVKKPQN